MSLYFMSIYFLNIYNVHLFLIIVFFHEKEYIYIYIINTLFDIKWTLFHLFVFPRFESKNVINELIIINIY